MPHGVLYSVGRCDMLKPKEDYVLCYIEYCKDCDRSIYGSLHDCDINIENNGNYVLSDDKCYCKIINGQRAEKYYWE